MSRGQNIPQIEKKKYQFTQGDMSLQLKILDCYVTLCVLTIDSFFNLIFQPFQPWKLARVRENISLRVFFFLRLS